MTYRDAEPPPHRAPPAPPPRRRARRSPGEGREQILRAATGEFVTHGFAGARISRIVAKAGSNPRMIYHYFGSKSGLYIAVIEEALGGLRKRELQIGVDRTDAREGLLQLFDFLADYFDRNRHLVRLLSAENLAKAKFLRKSTRIPEMSSPVLAMIEQLIAPRHHGRPAAARPRRLAPLCADGRAHPVSPVERPHAVGDLRHRSLRGPWRAARTADARRMLSAFLTPQSKPMDLPINPAR